MILSSSKNVARCFTFMLSIAGPSFVTAQTNETDSPTAAPTILSIITETPTIAPITSAPISAAPIASVITSAPTTSVPETLAPVSESPTSSPIKAETNAPTASSTEVVTNPPTTLSPVTLAPTVATVAPTVTTVAPTQRIITVAPTTSTNTTAPTKSPTTLAPTDSPSITPTLKVTSAAPSQTSTTDSPSASPSSSPTQSPSQSKTASPTSYIKPTTVSGLKVILTGISRIEDTSNWATTTSNFFATQYEESEQMSNIKVEITFTSEKSTSARERAMMRRRRRLQSDAVEVTYEQITTYSTTNPSLTLNDVLQMPLMDDTQQNDYIAALKKLNGYTDLTAVSTISLPTDDANDDVVDPSKPDEGTSFPLWAIITIAVGGAALLICICPFVYRKCTRSNRESDFPPPQAAQVNAGEETVGTMDYDYSKAYANSGNFSLSDAGGTLGSRTRQTADLMPPTGNNTIFSEDPTYNEAAYETGREEMFDIYAPAGKLGVVIDTPNDGAPIVHAVKDSSPIADKIRVGDKLVAVDDQDVRTMTAIQVSKLISKKSVNASRKMTVIRNV